MYRFNMTLVRIPAGLSAETDKLILKFTQHYKEPQGAQTILNENKVGGATLPV